MNNWRKVIEIQKNLKKGINDKQLNDYYSITEIMDILDIPTRETIYCWIKEGKVKDYKSLPYGKKFRYFISKKEIDKIKNNKKLIGKCF